jgi:hypothetical protein
MSDVWAEMNGGGFEPPAIPIAARNTNRPGLQSIRFSVHFKDLTQFWFLPKTARIL